MSQYKDIYMIKMYGLLRGVSLMFRKLSKPFSRNLCIAEIILHLRISSWNFVLAEIILLLRISSWNFVLSCMSMILLCCILTHWGQDKMAAIFQKTFSNGFSWILINISLKFVPRGPINNIPTLVQVMAWRRPGDKPLSEPMMVNLLTHICVTRPQWVKGCLWNFEPNVQLYDFP